MAHLLLTERERIDFSLNDYASEARLTRSFLQNGVKDLIDTGWLRSKEPHDIVLKTAAPKRQLSQWQKSLADALMFPNRAAKPEWLETSLKSAPTSNKAPRKAIPSNHEMVLLYLVISANDRGFVQSVSTSDIEDHCGISKHSVTKQLNKLCKLELIERYPGGYSRKIEGYGVNFNSVFTIHQKLIRATADNPQEKPLALEDLDSDDFLMPKLYPEPPWFECWDKATRESLPKSLIAGDPVSSKLYDNLHESITDQIKPNILSRIVSGADLILASEELSKHLITVLFGKLNQEKALNELFDALTSNHSCGVHLRNSTLLSAKDLQIEADETSKPTPLMLEKLVTSTLCLQAMRLAASLMRRRGIITANQNSREPSDRSNGTEEVK